jgi:type I restriction enzyme M protein
MVRLGDVCEINPKKNEVAGLSPSTLVSFVPMADLGEHQILFSPKDEKSLSDVGSSYTYFRDNDVLVAKVTPCFENGKAGIARGLRNGIGFGSSEFYVLRPSEQILPEYVYFCVTNSLFREAAVSQMTGTGGLQRVPRGYVEDFQIPLPPLEIQREIVAEIEGYQKVINGARAVLDNYRPHIPINPTWPMVDIRSVSDRITKGTTPTTGGHSYQPEGITFLKVESIAEDGSRIPSKFAFISEDCHNEQQRSQLKDGDVLFSIAGALGRVGLVPPQILPANTNQALSIITPKNDLILSSYLSISLRTPDVLAQAEKQKTGVAQYNLSLQQVGDLTIPLPPLAEQQAIVAEIEAEQALVNANRKLITRFEAKIQTTLSRIWGD